jgi:tRNA U34 5-carboxymethylaminomethyl modifying GTPase MnmE/TrmE
MAESDDFCTPRDEAAEEELSQALDEALGEVPRSRELREMKRVLAERHARLASDLDHADNDREREALRRELKKLDEHIAVLAEEAEITQFVEDAVRVGIEMRRMNG